mmetsp:Transcript_9471/g.35153  ORF Transcript_9471/g.35153 Transcript_9471/m.35153 type:complete len:119 (+) Transcript_9471:3-359(+)
MSLAPSPQQHVSLTSKSARFPNTTLTCISQQLHHIFLSSLPPHTHTREFLLAAEQQHISLSPSLELHSVFCLFSKECVSDPASTTARGYPSIRVSQTAQSQQHSHTHTPPHSNLSTIL